MTTISMKNTSNDASHLPPSPSNVPTQSYQAAARPTGISVHYTDTSHPTESINSTPLTFLPKPESPSSFLRDEPALAAISMGTSETSSWDQLRGFSWTRSCVCCLPTHPFSTRRRRHHNWFSWSLLRGLLISPHP